MKKSIRCGDVVEVKSAAEILNTLDPDGTYSALPFMPEMLQYCGRRFVVGKKAEKICDTIKTYGSRRMKDTVILEDLRCDGSKHDGCQAECRIFWRIEWVRPMDPKEPLVASCSTDESVNALNELTSRKSKQVVEKDGHLVHIYRCQATELYKASTPLSVWDPRPYIRQFTSGNVSFGHFLRVSLRALFEEPMRKLRLISAIPLPGTRTGPAQDNHLGLKSGDWVQVKTREEIAATLTPDGRERGLWFDREMLPFCGGTYQIRQLVKRFIDDRTGRMIELKRDAFTLNGVVCSGDKSIHRHFCPRAIYPYWRENWLRRVQPPTIFPRSNEAYATSSEPRTLTPTTP